MTGFFSLGSRSKTRDAMRILRRRQTILIAILIGILIYKYFFFRESHELPLFACSMAFAGPGFMIWMMISIFRLERAEKANAEQTTTADQLPPERPEKANAEQLKPADQQPHFDLPKYPC